jgi:hypothetical protein
VPAGSQAASEAIRRRATLDWLPAGATIGRKSAGLKKRKEKEKNTRKTPQHNHPIGSTSSKRPDGKESEYYF